MRLLLIGPTGSGKTTAFLELRSMMPHYFSYNRNYEGEADISFPDRTTIMTVEDVDLTSASIMSEKSDVIFLIQEYNAATMKRMVNPDLTICINASPQTRIQRIVNRPPHYPRHLVEHSVQDDMKLDYPSMADIIVNNDGTRSELTKWLIQFVNERNLRPQAKS